MFVSYSIYLCPFFERVLPDRVGVGFMLHVACKVPESDNDNLGTFDAER